MANGSSRQKNRLRGRKILMGLNTWVGVFLALSIFVMLNYFSHRHGVRFSLNTSDKPLLSPTTTDLLSELDREIDIVVFFRPSNELYHKTRLLLREYEFETSKIKMTFVDPDRDLAKAEGLARRYEVADANVIVFASGNRKQIVSEKDIAEYDYTPTLSGEPKKLVAFRGEQAFSSAIYTVIQDTKPVIYFLTGHGERKIDDYDRHRGCSGIARLLRRDNMELKTLELGKTGRIPENCDTLIVPGPRKSFTHAEREMINDYLTKGGSALFMFDSDVETGMEELMSAWGVQIGKNRVFGMTLTGYELLVTSYGKHAITEKLEGFTTIFNMPRAIEPERTDAEKVAEAVDKPTVTILASGEWAENPPPRTPPRFDPEKDRKGPVAVAVAVEKGASRDVKLQIKPTRIVITGDSTMICNGAVAAGYNLDFFINSVRWLLDRDSSLLIEPETYTGARIILSRGKTQMLFWILTAGIPAIAAIAGVIVRIRRRK